MPFDVFALRDSVVGEYRDYFESFVNILDGHVEDFVLLELGGEPIEKAIDVRLATDMLTRAYKDHFDVAILVSGDNDFTDLVQAVKDQGKHVEAALFDPPTSSRQLREAADKVTVIDAALLAKCWR